MTTDDTAGKPRKTKDRLAAMQAKAAAPKAVPEPAPVPEPVPEPAPAPAAASGAASGLMADLQAAIAGGQGGRAAIMQRLRQALSGPDGQIDPQRARMALMFVHKQAGDPAAPRHELAKRVEDFVRNMPAQQRQRLMAAAGLSGAMLPGGAAGGGQGQPRRGKGAWAANGAGNGAGARKAGPGGRARAAGGDGTQGEAWFENFLDKQ